MAVEAAIAVGLKAFECFLVYLNNIQSSSEIKCKLEESKTELREMEAVLKDSENCIDEGNGSFLVYIRHVQDLVHDIEDVVDEFLLAGVASESRNKLKKVIISAWSKCSSKRSKAMKEIADLLERGQRVSSSSPSSTSSSTILSNQDIVDGDELVGFEMYEEELFQKLREQNRLLILVSGPGGSGKTSLVNKVYQKDEVVFSVRQWFTGTEFPEKLGGVNKFLVVSDDVWSNLPKRIQHVLAKDTVGSKIVITSRNSGIASSMNPKYIVDLSRGLSSENAKKLFCREAFQDGQGNWPPELEHEAQQLLDKCEGIPLSISTVANFLRSNKKEIPSEWHTVHVSLGSELRKDDSDLSTIRRNLQPSYRELPSHLKDCFLYFSMFPSGEEINRGRLMRLWVAENFAKPEEGKTGEQVAEDYLNELVQRNLVVVCKAGTRDRVSKCRVLKLVHEINISRRYNFMTVLESDYRSPCGNNGKIRRLSAQNGVFKSLKWKKNMSDMTGLRSFLVFGQRTSLSDLKMVLEESKFLKVLDLQGLPNLEQFPDQIFDLILLKYLSMRGTQVDRIPKRIKKLVQLETLDLKRTKVTQLPEEVYKLQNLLTLLVSSSSGKQQGAAQAVQVSRGVSSFSSIQRLSLITVDTEECIQALKELEYLRKLGVVTKDGSELANVLEKMKHLTTLDVRSSGVQALNLDECTFPEYLERLHLSGVLVRGALPKQISQPKSLQKISLYGSNLTAQPLDHLQDLPCLIELDLRGYYNGSELEFKADKFKKLETLIIQGFTKLKTIVFENGATPKLKRLTISSCHELVNTEIRLPTNFTAEIFRDGELLQMGQLI